MKRKNIKKFIIILSIGFLLCFFVQQLTGISVFAEVNTKYGTPVGNAANSYQNEQKSDGLLGLLGIAVYSFGSLIEWLTSNIMAMFTSTKFFPWADKIIFNNVSMLDCNFINPGIGSLFKDASGFTTIGNTVRTIYFTGLSIALGFLGIVVAVMAIKIAISTIASEKAKYKESIKDWVMAMILIFGMHYVLAFCFYLNEKLVEVASTIVLNIAQETGKSDAFSSMGENFKDTAVPEGTNIFNLDKVNVTESFLYTILVIQSLMFLFAYLKRFFYVVILGVIAPFVVIYDFLSKVI